MTSHVFDASVSVSASDSPNIKPAPSWIVLHCSRWRPSLYRLVCFSESQGISNHFVFPSQIAKRRFQPGDIIAGTIDNRTFDVHTVFSPQVFAIVSGLKLAILSCVTELLQLTLPEGHPYPHLYQAAEQLLHSLACHLKPCLPPEALANGGRKDNEISSHQQENLPTNEQILPVGGLVAAYSAFELLLLAEIGFGLSIDSCAVTGAVTDLAYISPKTGRAVSRAAGAAYHDKLLLFPDVWRTPPQGNDWSQAIAVTEFFIKKQLRQGQELPFMRGQLTC